MQLNWNVFVRRIVTGDETWIHHCDSETIERSMQWKHASSPSPRKLKVQTSACKIMCTVFSDAEGILLIDYTPHKLTVYEAYSLYSLYRRLIADSIAVCYADLLVAVKEKRRGKLTQVPVLLHDSTSAHRSHVGQAAVLECGFEEMCHPPYF